MHFAFIPYGHWLSLEAFFADIKAMKVKHKRVSKDGKESFQWIQMGLRILPFGIYELTFPKEYKDIVLNTFCKGSEKAYKIPRTALFAVRKALRLKPIPKTWDTSEKFLLSDVPVSIIPIGIKEDKLHNLSDGSVVEGI